MMGGFGGFGGGDSNGRGFEALRAVINAQGIHSEMSNAWSMIQSSIHPLARNNVNRMGSLNSSNRRQGTDWDVLESIFATRGKAGIKEDILRNLGGNDDLVY